MTWLLIVGASLLAVYLLIGLLFVRLINSSTRGKMTKKEKIFVFLHWYQYFMRQS